MLVLCLNTAPLLLMGLAWWFYRNESASLANWRRGVFVSAFVANAVSIAVLVSFFVHAYLVSRGAKPVDLDRMYPVSSMMGLALLAAVLAFFGRKVSRPILVSGGLVTMAVWYLAAMGASP